MKFLKLLLSIVVFCSSIVVGVNLFCNRIGQKEILYNAIGQIDMKEVVKEELGVQYPLLVKIVELPESKQVMATYSKGFIDYLSDKSVKVNIPKEELEDLYSKIADDLVEDFPVLAYLPKDKCVNFLLESINVSVMLPGYDVIEQRIPPKVLETYEQIKDQQVLMVSAGVLVISILLSLVIFRRKAWMSLAFSVLLAGGCFILLGQFRHEVIIRIDFAQYQYLAPFIEDLMKQLLWISNGYVALATLFVVIRILLGKEKKKAIADE